MKREDTLNTTLTHATDLLNPAEILDTMIELRIQLRALEEQIQVLQPAFFTACLALNTDRIALDQATISRRLTPGQWAYSADVLEQETLFKHLKQQFQQSHEPIAGREVIWAIKLLLTTA